MIDTYIHTYTHIRGDAISHLKIWMDVWVQVCEKDGIIVSSILMAYLNAWSDTLAQNKSTSFQFESKDGVSMKAYEYLCEIENSIA
jgi:hypothetical protein